MSSTGSCSEADPELCSLQKTQEQREKRHRYVRRGCFFSCVLFLRSSSLRFICDNLALPVPCHWERINTDEPYQVSRWTQTHSRIRVLPPEESDHLKVKRMDLGPCRLESVKKCGCSFILSKSHHRHAVEMMCGCWIKKDTFKFTQVIFPSVCNLFNIIQIHETQWQ